jgi:DNA invertase Pin-like site-specific DNA recombinase
MLEVMLWVQWLEVEQRHLVWMRAKRYGWREICTRFGFDRTTGWRHWNKAMQTMAEKLNESTAARK